MQKKTILFLLLTLLMCTTPAHAYKVKTFQPLAINPLAVPYNPYVTPGVNENYPKITQIEYALFKRAYEKQNIYTRLSRIERKLFKRNYNNLPLASRMDNITKNIDSGVMCNISNKDLIKLEKKVLGQTYEGDDTESRITRMEKEMLGAMQDGDLNTRLETITKASKHYNSYPEIVQSQTIYPQQSYYQSAPMGYYSPSNYGYWNTRTNQTGIGGFFRNLIGSAFNGYSGGTMTGFTPPIYDPYNRFAPGMGVIDEYRSNTRSYINNRNYGTGSGVRILD